MMEPSHVYTGALLAFLSTSAGTVLMPFMQAQRDRLGCDALCNGGQMSLRSAMGLVGATLIGRASDLFGRVPMLWVGLAGSAASIAIGATVDGLPGLWLAIVPTALFNQNFGIVKALFGDYAAEADADVAGAIGKLGGAVGLSLMAGPLLSSQVSADYHQALGLAAVLNVAAAAVILRLPRPAGRVRAAGDGVLGLLALPVLRTTGAKLLLLLRLLMSLAFYVFMPVMQVSLKRRFDFGPREHGKFMGVIGISYAASQMIVAKPVLARGDPVHVLVVCLAVLGGARPFALWTSSMLVVYAFYVLMVVALGVANTVVNAACARLADRSQLGGFYGVMESIESASGIVGPALGGLAARYREEAAVAAVLAFYGICMGLVAGFFRLHVFAPVQVRASKQE